MTSARPYVARKIDFLESAVREWPAGGSPAGELDALLADAVATLDGIFDGEALQQTRLLMSPDEAAGPPLDWASLLAQWLATAERGERLVGRAEARGHALANASAFRAGVGEARAALHPSDELTAAAATLADEARADHAAGLTDEWA